MTRRPSIDISERKIALRLLDIFISTTSVVLVNWFFKLDYLHLPNSQAYIWFTTYVSYLMFFGYIFELYNLRVSANYFRSVRSAFMTSAVVTLFYGITPKLTPILPSHRIEILAFFGAVFSSITLWRLAYIRFFTKTRFYKDIVFIGDAESLKELRKLTSSAETNFNILGRIDSDESSLFEGIPLIDLQNSTLMDFIEKRHVDEVVICNNSYDTSLKSKLNPQLAEVFEKGVNIRSFGDLYMDLTFCMPKVYLDTEFYQHLNFSSSHSNRFYLYSMRVLDVIFAILGLTLFSFMIPFLLIGNLIGNRGPFFYVQTRSGKHEKPFEMMKLRTMVPNAEKDGAQWAEKKDTRITLFGRFLRNSRLDEIPQLINVLKREMKLIGPRPERPEFVEQLAKEIPFYKLRQTVEPGLTGWAQVMYPYANSIEEQEKKLRYDLYYLKNRNFFRDFQIFVKTIGTVLAYRGQ